MNDHIEERLIEALIDGRPLTEDEATLIDSHPSLSTLAARIRMLRVELQIAQKSQLTSEQVIRYTELFSLIQQESRQSALLSRLHDGANELAARLTARLTWDSRQELAMQGVRNVASREYRLLYSSDFAEVELYVQPISTRRNITGELLFAQDAIGVSALFLQLIQEESTVDQTVIDSSGRFYLESLLPGSYAMTIVYPDGQLLQIESLELT